jgi:hypothetical protein
MNMRRGRVVQVRKHKGKAYVVDVPLSPYFRNVFGIGSIGQVEQSKTPAAPHLFDPHRERAASEAAKVLPEKLDHSEPKQKEKGIVAGSISELVRRMFNRACQFISR